jgi:thiol-disulfide isomerase/thioredoxin
MLTLHMVYSLECHACNGTKPIIREIASRYRGRILVVYENVKDKKIYRFFEQNLGFRIDEPDVSEQEKEMMRKEGQEVVHGLPTLYLTSSKRPMAILWKAQGGMTFEDNTREEMDEFQKEIEENLNKWLQAEKQMLGYWRDLN